MSKAVREFLQNIFPAPVKFFTQEPNPGLVKKFGRGASPHPGGGRYVVVDPETGLPVKDATGEFRENVVVTAGTPRPRMTVGPHIEGAPDELMLGTSKSLNDLYENIWKKSQDAPFYRKSKINLLRPGKYKLEKSPESFDPDSFIATVDDGARHYYANKIESPKGAHLNTYLGGEPTLRPTTKISNLEFGPQVGTISLQKKQHPLYEYIKLLSLPLLMNLVAGEELSESVTPTPQIEGARDVW